MIGALGGDRRSGKERRSGRERRHSQDSRVEYPPDRIGDLKQKSLRSWRIVDLRSGKDRRSGQDRRRSGFGKAN